jgi:hypothetical protein
MDIDVQLPSNRRDVFGRMVLTEDNKGYLLEQNHNGESTSEKGKPEDFQELWVILILKLRQQNKSKNGESLDLIVSVTGKET